MAEMTGPAGTGTINQSRRVKSISPRAKKSVQKQMRRKRKNRKRSNAVALHLKKDRRCFA